MQPFSNNNLTMVSNCKLDSLIASELMYVVRRADNMCVSMAYTNAQKECVFLGCMSTSVAKMQLFMSPCLFQAGIQLTRASARALTWSFKRAPAPSLRTWSSAAAAGLARATARPVMQDCMRSPASSVRALSSDVAAGMTGASPLEFLSEDEKMMQEAGA